MTDDEFLGHAAKILNDNAVLRARVEQLEMIVRELSDFDLPVTERLTPHSITPGIYHPQNKTDLDLLHGHLVRVNWVPGHRTTNNEGRLDTSGHERNGWKLDGRGGCYNYSQALRNIESFEVLD